MIHVSIGCLVGVEERKKKERLNNYIVKQSRRNRHTRKHMQTHTHTLPLHPHPSEHVCVCALLVVNEWLSKGVSQHVCPTADGTDKAFLFLLYNALWFIMSLAARPAIEAQRAMQHKPGADGPQPLEARTPIGSDYALTSLPSAALHIECETGALSPHRVLRACLPQLRFQVLQPACPSPPPAISSRPPTWIWNLCRSLTDILEDSQGQSEPFQQSWRCATWTLSFKPPSSRAGLPCRALVDHMLGVLKTTNEWLVIEHTKQTPDLLDFSLIGFCSDLKCSIGQIKWPEATPLLAICVAKKKRPC